MDQNYSGSIDFTEFLVAALNEDKLMNKTKIEQAFKMFDAVIFYKISSFPADFQKKTRMEMGLSLEKSWKRLLEEYQ